MAHSEPGKCSHYMENINGYIFYRGSSGSLKLMPGSGRGYSVIHCTCKYINRTSSILIEHPTD